MAVSLRGPREGGRVGGKVAVSLRGPREGGRVGGKVAVCHYGDHEMREDVKEHL